MDGGSVLDGSGLLFVDLLTVLGDRLARLLHARLADAGAQAVLRVFGKVVYVDARLIVQVGELDSHERSGHSGVDGHAAVVHAEEHGVGDHDGGRRARDHDGGDEAREGDEQVAPAAACEVAQAAVVYHINHDDGYVVGTARVERGVNKVVGANLRSGGLGGDGLDLAIRNHAREAVRAQDEPVALLDVELEVVCVHRRVRPERARDDRPVGVHAGLVRRDFARIDELLNIGVVVCDADERPLVQEVGARIANVRDGDDVALDVRCGSGAAHARLSQTVGCGLDDGGVSSFDGGGQACGVGFLRGQARDGLDRD